MTWKQKNKFSFMLSGLLALVIVLFSILSVVAVGDNQTQQQVPEQSEDADLNAIFDKQRDASNAGENIDEFLRCIPTGRTNRATSYPDYYAGSYIDDNGKLAVMLTDNTPEIRQALTEEAGNSAVRFEYATYSHEELTQMMDIISAKIETNLKSKNEGTHQPNICDDIRYFMLLDDQNAISVSVFNLTEDKIQTFKNEILDSAAIIFENTSGEMKEAAVSTNPGKKIGIIVGNSGTGLSTAFRVSRQTNAGKEYGFITCAHGNGNKIGAEVYSCSGNLYLGVLGTVELRRFGGAYDLSYVKLSSGSSASNIIFNTNYNLVGSNDNISNPLLGKFVVAYGQTSKTTSGYIRSVDFRGTMNGVAFSGLIAADYASKEGDSGGLVCSDKNGYNFNTMGVIVGHSTGEQRYAIFTSAKKAVNLWYLNRY